MNTTMKCQGLCLLILLILMGILISSPVMATATLNQSIKDTFDSMSNVTSAGSHMTQRRGVLSGGRYSVRYKPFRANVLTFTPPKVNAGCGGIDILGGSFSMINKEQWSQLLRSIAQNASGYAFQIAVAAMCGTCDQMMQALQKRIQEMTKGLKDSCTTAKWLVNKATGGGFQEAQKAGASRDNEMAGWVNDSFDGLEKILGMSPTQKQHDSASPAERREVESNIVWESLKNHSVANWYTAGVADPNELYRIIMSVTGTLVYRSDGTSFKPYLIKGELDFDTFYKGATGEPVNILDCGADTDKCLNPTSVVTPVTIKGMKELVDEQLLGPDGILSKIRNNSGDLTAEQQQFLESTKIPIAAMIRNTSAGAGLPELIIRQTSDVIAINMAYTLIYDLIQVAKFVVQDDVYVKGSELFLKQVKEVERELESNLDKIAKKENNLAQTFEMYKNLQQSLYKTSPQFLQWKSQYGHTE